MEENMDSVQLKSVIVSTNFDTNHDSTNAESNNTSEYIIYFNNLTYKVYRASIDKILSKIKNERPIPPDSRIILSAICGSFASSQMTALMGPSGAGKTTLLECLVGKRQIGLSGEIKVKRGRSSSGTKINLALVPQVGNFYGVLTVFETIQYSSLMKNSNSKNFNHHKVTLGIIRKFDLGRVKESLVSSLSGSELKRLAIGIEIVSAPNLLVLDEPTTGLDSFSAQKVLTYSRIFFMLYFYLHYHILYFCIHFHLLYLICFL